MKAEDKPVLCKGQGNTMKRLDYSNRCFAGCWIETGKQTVILACIGDPLIPTLYCIFKCHLSVTVTHIESLATNNNIDPPTMAKLATGRQQLSLVHVKVYVCC